MESYFLGDMVNLECLVSGGSPTPTQKWFRDSVEVSSQSEHSFLASVDDDGKVFRSDAINDAGTKSDAITLQVFCK